MKKQKMGMMLFILWICLLSGCSAPPAADTPMTEVSAAPAMATHSSHPTGEQSRELLASYAALLQRIDQEASASISHTIPEDMFLLLARYAEEMNITPAGGRYAFTAVEESTHSYRATGMEVEGNTAPNVTPDPADETPMDQSRMGDYSVSGGGSYKRTFHFDVAEDLTQGAIRITTALNGQDTGTEYYAFCLRPDGFHFADAAGDFAVELDALSASGTYLVAAGRMTKEKIQVVEYHISSLDDFPAPESMDFDGLKNRVERLSFLSADQQSVTFQ